MVDNSVSHTVHVEGDQTGTIVQQTAERGIVQSGDKSIAQVGDRATMTTQLVRSVGRFPLWLRVLVAVCVLTAVALVIAAAVSDLPWRTVVVPLAVAFLSLALGLVKYGR